MANVPVTIDEWRKLWSDLPPDRPGCGIVTTTPDLDEIPRLLNLMKTSTDPEIRGKAWVALQKLMGATYPRFDANANPKDMLKFIAQIEADYAFLRRKLGK